MPCLCNGCHHGRSVLWVNLFTGSNCSLLLSQGWLPLGTWLIGEHTLRGPLNCCQHDCIPCRDLKSANFLVQGDSRVVVADFGHATDNQADSKDPDAGTFKVLAVICLKGQ